MHVSSKLVVAGGALALCKCSNGRVLGQASPAAPADFPQGSNPLQRNAPMSLRRTRMTTLLWVPAPAASPQRTV